MAEEIVSAVVLRRSDQGESDRRLVLLTRELGKIEVIAKGARKSASRLAGISDPLSISTLHLASGRRTRYVTQAQPQTSLPGLRRDLLRLECALALAELTAMVVPPEEHDPARFDALVRALVHIEHQPRPDAAWLWAETRQLADSGFFPELNRCVATGEPVHPRDPLFSRQAGGVLAEGAPPAADQVRVPREVLIAVRRMGDLDEPPPALRMAPEVGAFLLAQWEFVLERPRPAGRAVLDAVRMARAEAADQMSREA